MPYAFIVAGLPLQVNWSKLRIPLPFSLLWTQYLVEVCLPRSPFPTRYRTAPACDCLQFSPFLTMIASDFWSDFWRFALLTSHFTSVILTEAAQSSNDRLEVEGLRKISC